MRRPVVFMFYPKPAKIIYVGTAFIENERERKQRESREKENNKKINNT